MVPGAAASEDALPPRDETLAPGEPPVQSLSSSLADTKDPPGEERPGGPASVCALVPSPVGVPTQKHSMF